MTQQKKYTSLEEIKSALIESKNWDTVEIIGNILRCERGLLRVEFIPTVAPGLIEILIEDHAGYGVKFPVDLRFVDIVDRVKNDFGRLYDAYKYSHGIMMYAGGCGQTKNITVTKETVI